MRRILVLALLATGVLLPATQVQAQQVRGGGSALLRYRFTADEHLRYRFTLHLNIRVAVTGAAAPRDSAGVAAFLGAGTSDDGAGTLDTHVLSVDSGGVATVAQTTNAFVSTLVARGKTTTQTVPTTTTMAMIHPNGALSGAVPGSDTAYFAGFGVLPPGPSYRGATWTSTSTLSILDDLATAFTIGLRAKVPSSPLVVQNTLTGYGQEGGELAAHMTATSAHTQALAIIGGPTATWSTQATEQLAFGLESHSTLVQESHEQGMLTYTVPFATRQKQVRFTFLFHYDLTLRKL